MDSPSLGDEFRRLRLAAGFGTSTALADALGVTRSYVSMIETGKRVDLSPELWAKASAALGVPLNHFARWYAPGVQVPPPPALTQRPAPTWPKPIPKRGTVGAGPGQDDPADDGEVFDFEKVFGGTDSVFDVAGNSMVDMNIQDGDELFVRHDESPPDGCVVVVWVAAQDEHLVKVIRGEPGGRRTLEGRNGNNGACAIPLRLEDGDRIIGVVTRAIGRVDRVFWSPSLPPPAPTPMPKPKKPRKK